MSSNIDFDSLESLIKEVSPDRNYWLIRTNGGEYYREFLDKKYIAIGHNEIKLSDIEDAFQNGLQAKSVLFNRVKGHFKDKPRRAKRIVSQVLKFSYEIKKGDIVISPSANSGMFAFGEVMDHAAYSDIPTNEKGACPYYKRRKIKWLKESNRYSLDTKLYGLVFSHQALVSANNYEEFIDRTLHGLYRKNGLTHLIMEVRTHNKVEMDDMFGFSEIKPIIEGFAQENNIQLSTRGISSKVGVQSEGVIEFISQHTDAIMAVGAVLGILIIGFVGGKAEIKFTKEVKSGTLQTDGFITKIANYLSSRNKDKAVTTLVETIKNMDVKSPKEIAAVIEKVPKKIVYLANENAKKNAITYR